nr:hypothetical protein [Tanacetum cinerariifolium]
ETITYDVDMFRDTLQLPVETHGHLFIKPADLKFTQRFLKIVGYERIVDKRLDENYHSIKDDIPFVSIYTTWNDIRGMLIPNEFLTDDICATIEYKETHRVTRLPMPAAIEKKKRKQVARESSTPRKSLKITIKQKKSSTTLISPSSDDRERGEIDEATLLIFHDEEDTGTRIEPESPKEHPETVYDDDNNVDKQMKNDDVEKKTMM